MPDIWRYVVIHDRGFAPHVDNDFLTLCTCKPIIRRCAKVGDYILGFNDTNHGSGTLIWAGIVSEKLLMGDYAERYPRRRDVIYRRFGWELDGREKLSHYGGPEHNARQLIERDISGRYVLIFMTFWYWGKNAIILPHALNDLIYQSRGQKKRLPRQELSSLLEQWLASQPTGIHGGPRDL